MSQIEDAADSGAAFDVATVAGAGLFGSLVLGGISGYRNAVDPSKGMPKWKLGLDAGFGIAGLLGAVFLEDTAALISLGLGMSGVCSVGKDYGQTGGAFVATMLGKAGPHPAVESGPSNPVVKGSGGGEEQIHQGGTETMAPKQRKGYEAYVGR